MKTSRLGTALAATGARTTAAPTQPPSGDDHEFSGDPASARRESSSRPSR